MTQHSSPSRSAAAISATRLGVGLLALEDAEGAADTLVGAPAGQQLERLVDVGDGPAAGLRVGVGDHDAVVGGGERALVQVEHRGAAAVAQVQRDLAGERGDVGHQARVGAGAGREVQLEHALAGSRRR